MRYSGFFIYLKTKKTSYFPSALLKISNYLIIRSYGSSEDENQEGITHLEYK